MFLVKYYIFIIKKQNTTEIITKLNNITQI